MDNIKEEIIEHPIDKKLRKLKLTHIPTGYTVEDILDNNIESCRVRLKMILSTKVNRGDYKSLFLKEGY